MRSCVPDSKWSKWIEWHVPDQALGPPSSYLFRSDRIQMTCAAMGLPMSSSTLRGKALLPKAAPVGCHRRGLAGGVRSSADEHHGLLLRDPASRAALLCASISSASLLVQGAAAAASAVVAKQQASAENLTVPVFLSVLLAGAVYGVSTDPSLRRLVEESTKPSTR